jgi:hypothetical protein
VQLVLKRAGVASHGKVATLLLETFIEDSGRLTASKVVSRGVCNDGEFSLWRKQMIEKGWLIWSETQADKGQYFPGKKLMSYINKEKMISKEIVTKDEVLSKEDAATRVELEAVKRKLDATEARVSTIEKSMNKLYKDLDLGEPDPPVYGKLHVRLAASKN